MKKRLFSLALALCLCLALLPATATATEQQEKQARVLFALGLFNGYDSTGTNFGLGDSLPREQALILLIRLLG